MVAAVLLASCAAPSAPVDQADEAASNATTPTSLPAGMASPGETTSGTSPTTSPPVLHTNIAFTTLSIEDGLSQSVVTSILQDSRGFMWFGTQDGLNRFDGYEFVVYKHEGDDPTSLSDNFVLSLREDRWGDLWIGTNGGGLNRFDRGTETFTRYMHNPDDPTSLGHDVINAIYEDSQGVLWLATGG